MSLIELARKAKLLPRRDGGGDGGDCAESGRRRETTTIVVGGSPFSSPPVSRLVRLYCLAGVIPAYLSADGCSFVVRCWRHLKPIVLVFLVVAVEVYLVLGNIGVEEAYDDQSKTSETDKTVQKLEGQLNLVYFLVSMWANHLSFSQCYRINTRLAHSSGVRYAAPGPVLKHHALMVGTFLVVSAMDEVEYWADNPGAVAYWPAGFAIKVLIELLFNLYFFAILSVSELAMGRLLQCLGSFLSASLDDINGKRIEVREFCDRIDTVRHCYGNMGKIFGNNMLLLIIMSLVQMIWQSYFLVARLFDSSLEPLVSWDSSQNVLLIFISLKRLAHLTGAVHDFRKRVDEVNEKLIDLEANASDPKEKSCALRMYRLLSDIREGLSVRGFFIVDRMVFPELLGFFLTYLVLLVEFRSNESAGNNRSGPNDSSAQGDVVGIGKMDMNATTAGQLGVE